MKMAIPAVIVISLASTRGAADPVVMDITSVHHHDQTFVTWKSAV
jgi:hypothetical protein